MTIERVLITGGGGQLATDLEDRLGSDADVRAPARTELDVTDDVTVDRVFSDFAPTLVINCAAFHNVDVCEREEDRALEVNTRAVARLARRCAQQPAKFVHLNTNYAFDGLARDPYTEESVPSIVAYNDPDVASVWPPPEELTPSQRDCTAPRLYDIESDLPFVYAPSTVI